MAQEKAKYMPKCAFQPLTFFQKKFNLSANNRQPKDKSGSNLVKTSIGN